MASATCSFFFNDTATTEIYALSLHDALPISPTPATMRVAQMDPGPMPTLTASAPASMSARAASAVAMLPADRKSTRLNSSHSHISYAVLCLKKKILWSAHVPGRRLTQYELGC